MIVSARGGVYEREGRYQGHGWPRDGCHRCVCGQRQISACNGERLVFEKEK